MPSHNDGERATEQAMTSVFYDVIGLESVRDARTCLLKAIFDVFFLENFNPKMLSANVLAPKKALPYVTTGVLSYCASKSIHE